MTSRADDLTSALGRKATAETKPHRRERHLSKSEQNALYECYVSGSVSMELFGAHGSYAKAKARQALAPMGLTELYLDTAGKQRMRLTERGRIMMQAWYDY